LKLTAWLLVYQKPPRAASATRHAPTTIFLARRTRRASNPFTTSGFDCIVASEAFNDAAAVAEP
jgi:hypothetical protein